MQNYEIIVIDDKKLLEAIGDIQLAIPKANIEENNLYMSSSKVMDIDYQHFICVMLQIWYKWRYINLF